MAKLALILGDQLTSDISSLSHINKDNDHILMAELQTEATYVKHHKHKIVFLFSAMRHFAQELKDKGFSVTYIDYTHKDNQGSFEKQVKHFTTTNDISEIHITEPGEYRLKENFESWSESLKRPVHIHEDTRFVCTHNTFDDWAKDRKNLTMEYFYREMRRSTGLLLDGKDPVGGKWNFDKDNRKKWQKNLEFPHRRYFRPDDITQDVIDLVNQHFEDHMGDTDTFDHAVTRAEALKALNHFIEHALPSFGDYQDIMQTGEAFLFHSCLSFYLNAGLLTPLEMCEKAVQAYEDNHAPINAVEGFVRQIIGWREFIRGVYWRFMPEYKQRNTLKASIPLPSFYWDADTDMKCISEVVTMTQQHAYSHHIQRLMVTGNFALLSGLDVMEVCDWYLAVYGDAYEWVELPNTLGMALHADDAVVGTKPYIASGSYIKRMSNFCSSCAYDVKDKESEDACPFNYLYWDFLIRHKKHFENNHRMGIAYKNLEKMNDDTRKAVRKNAKTFLEKLQGGKHV